VKISPVGLYYKERAIFRSDALVVFGASIDASVHFDRYREDQQEAVRDLTREIEEALRALTLHVPRQEDEPLLASLRQIFAAEAGGMRERLETDQALIQAVEYFRHRDRSRYRKLRRKILGYSRLLTSLGLAHDQVDRKYRIVPILRYVAPRATFAAVGLPLFLFGAVNNFLPYKAPAWLSRLLMRDVVEVATIKFLSGLAGFPLFYFLQSWLVGRALGAATAWFYLGLLPLSGLFALSYMEALEGFADEIRVFFLHLTRQDIVGKLKTRRECILEELELCREQYLQEVRGNQ
jgi:hypothetical protein